MSDLNIGEWGTGEPTLVVVHGFTGSMFDFHGQWEWLAESRRVIGYDARGHGDSPRADSYSVAGLVADLREVIRAHTEGPVDLLGHSLGGRVALELALDDPVSVRSLLLMDSTARSFASDPELADLIAQSFASMSDEEIATMDFPGPEAEILAEMNDGVWHEAKAEQRAAVDPLAVRSLGAEIFGGHLDDLGLHLGAVTCPVTLLAGQHDEPFVGAARDDVDRFGDAELVIIDDAYHSPQATHSDEWRAAVAVHLGRASAVA